MKVRIVEIEFDVPEMYEECDAEEVYCVNEISDTFNVPASLISRAVNPTNISNTFNSLGNGEIVPE